MIPTTRTAVLANDCKRLLPTISSQRIEPITVFYTYVPRNSRRMLLHLTTNSMQALVQAMVTPQLDYTNYLLSGLPASATKPREMLYNRGAWVVHPSEAFPRISAPRLFPLAPCSCPNQVQHFGYVLRDHRQICPPISTRPDRSLHPKQATALLHLCPLGGSTYKRSNIKSTKIFTARIKLNTVVTSYQTINRSDPQIYKSRSPPRCTPTGLLRSSGSDHLVALHVEGPTSKAPRFSVLAHMWWNDLPLSLRSAESLRTFKKSLETHLFRTHLFPDLE
ncbi:hypothetical protein Z043_113974, partial [Scleropages formosus]